MHNTYTFAFATLLKVESWWVQSKVILVRGFFQPKMILLFLCLIIHQIRCIVVLSPKTLTSMVEVELNKSLKTRFLLISSVRGTELSTTTISVLSYFINLQYLIYLTILSSESDPAYHRIFRFLLTSVSSQSWTAGRQPATTISDVVSCAAH